MIEQPDLRDPYELALKELVQLSNRKVVESKSLEQVFEERAGLTIDNFMESLYPLFKSEGLLIENVSRACDLIHQALEKAHLKSKQADISPSHE